MKSRHISCLALILFTGNIRAQQTSGSIEGRVVDPQGAAVAGAKITLTDQRQGSIRNETTKSGGTFAFTPVLASDYTLAVEAPGFSKLEQKDIRLFAADKMSLPDIVLAVGAVTDNHQRKTKKTASLKSPPIGGRS